MPKSRFKSALVLSGGSARAVTDVLLIPQVSDIHWSNFQAIDQCMVAGHEAVRRKLWTIRRKGFIRQLATLGGLIHPARSSAWRRPTAFI